MACFVAPLGEAIVVTVIQKIIEKKEKKTGTIHIEKGGLTWSRRLGWLNKLLWGGTALLALEHVWHGEVVPWPPFLTAINNPGDIAPMLHELVTVGGAMTAVVTIVWAIIVLIAELKTKGMPLREVKPVRGAQ
jgi:hypothetical protein